MTNGKSTIYRRGRRIFKLFQDSLFQSSIIDDWEMYLVNMVLWLENALCTGWIMRSGAGGKLHARSVEGSGASLWAPKSPLSAYNTNPVRNFYRWRSSETAPPFKFKNTVLTGKDCIRCWSEFRGTLPPRCIIMLRRVYGWFSGVKVTHHKPYTTSETDIHLFSTFCNRYISRI